MNYEDLRRFQRMEKNSARLGEIGNSFYDDLTQLVRDCKEKCTSGTSEDARLFENVAKTARDIFDRREQKIIMKAMRFAKTNEIEKDAITGEEKAFADRLIDELKKNRTSFETLIAGENSSKSMEKIQNINDIPSIPNGLNEDLNIVMVRILKKVPKFVSGDLKEYGPFETNVIVRLPRKEADLLSNRNFVEMI